MLAAATPKLDWYTLRPNSLVALVLLTLTVPSVVGEPVKSNRSPRLVTAGLHRNLSLLALLLALHVLTAVLDSWVGLGWLGAVVPFESGYRPVWVGLGVVAGDLVVAVVATSLLRRRLSYRTWRLVHLGAWVLWPLAVLHAVGSGTDATRSWGLGVVVACVAVVGAAALWRLGRTCPTRRAPAIPTTGRQPGGIPVQ